MRRQRALQLLGAPLLLRLPQVEDVVLLTGKTELLPGVKKRHRGVA